MNLYVLIAPVIIFLLVSALPLIQWAFNNRAGEEVIEYSFPQELIECKMNDLDGDIILSKRMVGRYRGSVRMAQGRILTKKDLEAKKAEVYSVDLP